MQWSYSWIIDLFHKMYSYTVMSKFYCTQMYGLAKSIQFFILINSIFVDNIDLAYKVLSVINYIVRTNTTNKLKFDFLKLLAINCCIMLSRFWSLYFWCVGFISLIIELHNMKRVDHITKIYRTEKYVVIIVICCGSNFILFKLKISKNLDLFLGTWMHERWAGLDFYYLFYFVFSGIGNRIQYGDARYARE